MGCVLLEVRAEYLANMLLGRASGFNVLTTLIYVWPLIKTTTPVKSEKVKQSRYSPWRRLGGEEVYLLLIHDLGTRWG
jgi:hypothetical protein